MLHTHKHVPSPSFKSTPRKCRQEARGKENNVRAKQERQTPQGTLESSFSATAGAPTRFNFCFFFFAPTLLLFWVNVLVLFQWDDVALKQQNVLLNTDAALKEILQCYCISFTFHTHRGSMCVIPCYQECILGCSVPSGMGCSSLKFIIVFLFSFFFKNLMHFFSFFIFYWSLLRFHLCGLELNQVNPIYCCCNPLASFQML